MSVIDKVGRRKLLLTGAVGTAACLGGVATIFWTGRHEGLLVWLLVGFIASFAFSQGAVIWVYLSEVFPTSVRAKGQSLGSSTHWVMAALISWGFPIVAEYSKPASLRVFRSHDGGAIVCGCDYISGNQGRDARRDGKEACIGPLTACRSRNLGTASSGRGSASPSETEPRTKEAVTNDD